jgi:gluconokinase
MGVAGAGKSLIGASFARALGIDFVEGDDYHPPDNVARMASGTALTDEDRDGWLRALAGRLAEARVEGRGVVLSCSALKRRYRDRLRDGGGGPDLQLILLRGPQPLIAQRLAGRSGHYMPASLLESQLAALEEPSPEEGAWVCDIGASPRDIVAALVARASA